MKFAYTLLTLFSLLSINSIHFTAEKIDPKKESLKQILSFINEKSGQFSPVFDLSAKPYFDHVNAALERIIQKAADDKAFSTLPTSDDTERTAHILEQLHQNTPQLFLSDSELQEKARFDNHSSRTQRSSMNNPKSLETIDPPVYASEPAPEYLDTPLYSDASPREDFYGYDSSLSSDLAYDDMYNDNSYESTY